MHSHGIDKKTWKSFLILKKFTGQKLDDELFDCDKAFSPKTVSFGFYD